MAQDHVRLLAQGERLKQLRRPIPGTGGDGGRTRYEIPQQDAADAANVSLRAYQAYEGGTSDIGPEALDGLTKFFGVSRDFIRQGDTGPSQLDRIESMLADNAAKLDRLLSALAASGTPLDDPIDATARAIAKRPRPTLPSPAPSSEGHGKRRRQSS